MRENIFICQRVWWCDGKATGVANSNHEDELGGGSHRAR